VSPRPTRQSIAELLAEARARTIALIHPVGDELLNRVYSELLSPLAWDLGHIANFEELWLVQTVGGRKPLHGELGQYYDAIENPRRERGELPILHDAELRAYMSEVRERTLAVLDEVDIGPDAEDPLLREGFVYEMLVAHELQHQETMMQLIQMLDAPYRPAEANPDAFGPAPVERAAGTVRVEAGTYEIGAPDRGFAYDNERPRHHTDVRGFMIGRSPITNATYLHFVEGGGYERREWWSDEGWAWKEEEDITHHPAVAAGHAEAPACHVSWFEADAFARAQGARLPTEAEWEKASTWTQGTASAGEPEGMLIGAGRVWEWTRSHFNGYPGFRAHPYREYSEVFFARGYRVLRGASWATDARVASVHFRNWDLPQRRQIFAGVRLARDAGRRGGGIARPTR
jgi:gamma-glutamyl hercynylcysteine S-oxide synthase